MATPDESVARILKIGNSLYVNLSKQVVSTLGVKKGDVLALAHGRGVVKMTKIPLRDAYIRMEASKANARELTTS